VAWVRKRASVGYQCGKGSRCPRTRPDPYADAVKPRSTRAPTPPPGLETEAPSTGQTQRIAGLTVGGVGIVGVVAIFETRLALSGADACPEAACSQSRSQSMRSANQWATISDASLVAGAVALATGAIVFFTAPRSSTGASVAIGVGPTPGGATLSADGRF
jgi:hypothetical protein